LAAAILEEVESERRWDELFQRLASRAKTVPRLVTVRLMVMLGDKAREPQSGL
jgi:hypothetical protein